MFGLGLTETHRSHSSTRNSTSGPQLQQHQHQNEISSGRKRRLRRKKNKTRQGSLIPPIPAPPKFSSRSEKHVARDLCLTLQCSWRDVRRKQLDRVLLTNWEGGIYFEHAVDQDNFAQVRSKIMNKIDGKVLVGHGLKDCLHSLKIQHPWKNLRDAASYLPFMKETADPLSVLVLPRKLQDLAGAILGRTLPQVDSPNLLHEEAKACMDLYRSVRFDWENETTKLIQQKERQRDVLLEQRHAPLTSISEDTSVATSGEPGAILTYDLVAGLESAPPVTVTSSKKFGSLEDHDAPEDQSTQAPTEATPDESSVGDDLSVKTVASADQSIWMPPNAVSLDGNGTVVSAGSSWGLWLPRPEESTHPIDADDWLNEDENNTNTGRSFNPTVYSTEQRGEAEHVQKPEEESFGLLPSRLLLDSSDESDHEALVREETNHFVEGMDYEDWLEPDLGLRQANNKIRDGWLVRGRRKSALDDSKRSNTSNVNPQQPQQVPSSEEDVPRQHAQGERDPKGSADDSDWALADEAKSSEPTAPKFSFLIRKNSIPLSDEVGPDLAGEDSVLSSSKVTCSPGRFSLFWRKSLEDHPAAKPTSNLYPPSLE